MEDANLSVRPDGSQYRNYREERRGRGVLFSQPTEPIRNQAIPMCDHKFVQGSEPRHRNCESCWFTFFKVHGELTQSCDEVFSTFGKPGLIQLRGPKFADNYLKFMATIAQWKKASDEAAALDKDHNEQRTHGAGESATSSFEADSGAEGIVPGIFIEDCEYGRQGSAL